MSLAFTSWSFDATSYVPLAPITLTALFTSTDVADAADVASAVTVALADTASGTVTQTSDTSGNFPSFTVATPGAGSEPVAVSATDTQTPAGAWTLVSSTTSDVAPPFAYTAVLTGVAA